MSYQKAKQSLHVPDVKTDGEPVLPTSKSWRLA